METSEEQIESIGLVEQKKDSRVGRQNSGARALSDFRTLRRIATALSIVLGPLAVGVVRAFVPAVNPSDGKAAIAAMMTHSDMARVELAAGVVATLFLPFGIVGLTRLVMRRTPVLAMIGGGFALVGWTLIPALVMSDAMTYTMAQSGVNPAQLASLWDQVNANSVVSLLSVFFVVGHELGTLLLGIGLARGRVVPLWASIAVVVGILLHPVGFALGIQLVDILGFALLIAGCLAAARVVLTTPNDTWDLPRILPYQ